MNMQYVKINSDGSIKYPYDLQELRNQFKHIILPAKIPSTILEENNIFSVEILEAMSYDSTNYKCTRHEQPVYLNNQWVLGYDIIEYSDEEKNLKLFEFTQNIRERRNKLLAESDWTQLKDVQEPVSSKWQIYRQGLRDLPSQDGFPFNITWPLKPENN
jgi:hypothetical protein